MILPIERHTETCIILTDIRNLCGHGNIEQIRHSQDRYGISSHGITRFRMTAPIQTALRRIIRARRYSSYDTGRHHGGKQNR